MKLNVKIMPKNGVLDPQGKAIENSLSQLGFKNFSEIRQGKIIEIDIDADKDQAINIADESFTDNEISVSKKSLFSFTFFWTNSSNPGS